KAKSPRRWLGVACLPVDLLPQEFSQRGPTRPAHFPFDGRSVDFRQHHFCQRGRTPGVLTLEVTFTVVEEAVERVTAGQTVAAETFLDAQQAPLGEGPAPVAARLELVGGMAAEPGLEVPFLRADRAQSARPAGKQQEATQAE